MKQLSDNRFRILLFAVLLPAWSWADQADDAQNVNDAMAEMMAKAARYTQPGEAHQVLQRFIGEWNTETKITMGQVPEQGEMGSVTYSWLMPGRWLKAEGSGNMMNMQVQTFSIMGYDNFKQSYVVTSVSTLDTAMNSSEGDMDPSGQAMLLYGTIDEYLTGEHDKMVKTVFRFISDDKFVMEVHDLPIGEKNTQVVEVTYTRKS